MSASPLRIEILETLEKGSTLWDQWEELVKAGTASGIMQSLDWAEFKRRQGLTPLHVGVFDGEEALVGGGIFYASKRNTGAGLLVAPEGPVLPWGDEVLAGKCLRLIIDAVEQQARSAGVMAMRIEPRLPLPVPRLLREFGRAPMDLVPRETLYLDLTLSEDELLAGMRPKGRYNIKLSQRHGVTTVEDYDPQSVSRFYNVLKEASIRDDFALEPLSFFDHLAQVLCPAGLARFIFTEHEGDTLGAMLLVTYGDRATYLYGGVSNTKRNLMGGYALQWSAIQAARAAGCETYDFYGFNEFQVVGHPYTLFSQFKRKFGGQIVKFIGAHDCYFLDCLADAFIKAVQEIKPESNPGANRMSSRVLVLDDRPVN